MPSTGAHTTEPSGDARLPAHPDARLQKARDSHAVCWAVLFGRKDIQPDCGEAYPSTVADILEATRPGDPGGFDVARYRRQLKHSQTRQGEIVDTVAKPKAAESFWPGPHGDPLHPDLQFLDESGGAILPGYHRGRCSGRQFHHC